MRVLEKSPTIRPELGAALVLAQGASCATGRQETRQQSGSDLHANHKGRRQRLHGPGAGYQVFEKTRVEGRVRFRRGQDGKVDALIDRRNIEDVVWKEVQP